MNGSLSQRVRTGRVTGTRYVEVAITAFYIFLLTGLKDYAREYIRLSLLGVNNINDLVECTKVLPPEIKSFTSPDQNFLDQWLAGTIPKLGPVVRDGTTVTREIIGVISIEIKKRFKRFFA